MFTPAVMLTPGMAGRHPPLRLTTRVTARDFGTIKARLEYTVEAASNMCVVEPTRLPAAVPVAGDGPSFQSFLRSAGCTIRTLDSGFL